jgi:hypothetical protein
MTCDAIRSLFSEHVDGMLDAQDEDHFGAHLAGCPACRQALTRYEEPLAAIGSLAPELPQELRTRVSAAARRQGLVHRRLPLRWLLPAAAALVVAIGGLLLAGRRARETEAPACSTSLAHLARIEERALYAPLAPAEGQESVSLLARTIVVPEVLRASGPYRAATRNASRCGETWRLPLLSPYGDVLELRIAPAPRAAAAQAGGYQVVLDSRRVFYARVQWNEGGLRWSLEGRAPADELLRLAQELHGRARATRT